MRPIRKFWAKVQKGFVFIETRHAVCPLPLAVSFCFMALPQPKNKTAPSLERFIIVVDNVDMTI
jgi:hypothetical protein